MGCLTVLLDVLGLLFDVLCALHMEPRLRREPGATKQPMGAAAVVWAVGYMVAVLGSSCAVILRAPTDQAMDWGVVACVIGTSAVFLPVGVWLARRSRGTLSGPGQ